MDDGGIDDFIKLFEAPQVARKNIGPDHLSSRKTS